MNQILYFILVIIGLYIYFDIFWNVFILNEKYDFEEEDFINNENEESL